ncbi:short-chain dehydrogenase, partial [Xanthomonas perforans]
MQRVLIIGATSAIAEATARRYAARGAAIHLLGRQVPRLETIAADLTTRGARTSIGVLDVNDDAHHGQVLDAAWAALGGVDVVLVAHGTLPDQAACNASVELSLREFA